jgi:hypothetical protein
MSSSTFAPRRSVAAGFALAATFAISLQAGESKAQSRSCLAVDIVSGTCSKLEVSDKRVDFTTSSLMGFTPGANDRVTLGEEDAALSLFQLQYLFDPTQGGATGVSGTFKYTISVIEPAAAGRVLDRAESNITGGTLAGGAFTTTAASDAIPSGVLTAANSSSPSIQRNFIDGTTVAAFTQTFATTPSGTINSFGLQFTQRNPTPEVPGPLPIFGAGAAFGFSRKLRHRTRQAA